MTFMTSEGSFKPTVILFELINFLTMCKFK